MRMSRQIHNRIRVGFTTNWTRSGLNGFRGSLNSTVNPEVASGYKASYKRTTKQRPNRISLLQDSIETTLNTVYL